MKKHELLRCENHIVRVLKIAEEKILIVDCIKKSMPKWIDKIDLSRYEVCAESDLLSATNQTLLDIETMDAVRKRKMYMRFTCIAGVLPFTDHERKRREAISIIADEKKISKQTIRTYLWLYLVYQDISVLAPKVRKTKKELSQDEKNMRWALNRFFYTADKNSLNTAYTQMLKAKYSDPSGALNADYPTFYQFRYFYRKHRKMQNYCIARNGLTNYQRNHRPLLGDGVQAFAPAVGVGMLDATVCDIYLINDAGQLIGRPILTACVDAYSGLCCGYALSWEGGVYSLKNLMSNVITDKVSWCRQFGIMINREDWNCSFLPATLVTDMGREYASATFAQIADLGVTVINLPPYRPELKGIVEKFFDIVQNLYKPHLRGKGVIEPDYQERGAHDYRKDACLTMTAFEKILLYCIIFYNSQRVIEHFPYTEQMLEEGIKPHASDIWNYGLRQDGANLIPVDHKTLMLTLLPRTEGKFTRKGLIVNRLRYKNADFTERFLQGNRAVVAYNPDDVSTVWLFENGQYIPFELIESRFKACTLSEAEAMQTCQKSIVRKAVPDHIQASVHLSQNIETIANASISHGSTSVKEVRKNRLSEQAKAHIDFMKGSMDNESNGY